MKKLASATLTDEEQYILQVIRAARVIQEFLWSDMNVESGLEEFRRMFRKRVAKIEAISMDNPHWRVELNKRLLQTAAICVNLMAKMAGGRLTHDGIHPTMPGNLPDYDQPIDNHSGRETMQRTFRELNLTAITPSPFNPRRDFSGEDFIELTASIARVGVLEPILVRPIESDDTPFELVAGERRWRACHAAAKGNGGPDKAVIPAMIQEMGRRPGPGDPDHRKSPAQGSVRT